jgi:tetratricopeptide (TPR) repeat protein
MAALIDQIDTLLGHNVEHAARAISWPAGSQSAPQWAGLPLARIPTLGPLPAQSRMLHNRNPMFVGREADLKALAVLLQKNTSDEANQRPIAAITGLGGLGKTQLASEFVHRYGRYFTGGVFWLSFADPDRVATEVAACGSAGALDLHPDFAQRSLDEQVRLVLAAWRAPVIRLLIFDNCEDPRLLAQWLPTSGGCRVLLTSRRAHWDTTLGIQPLPLDVLERADSLALLRKHRPDVDDATLSAVADEVGDLPLALHLAGAYLARYRRSIQPAEYLALLRTTSLRRALLEQGHSLSPTGHVQNVGRTIAISFDQLDAGTAVDAGALALLARAACLAPGEPIPFQLLVQILPAAEGNSLYTEDAINRLLELGLLRSDSDDTLRMHRLIVAFVDSTMGEDLLAAQEAVEIALCREAELINRTGFPGLLLPWQGHLRAVGNRARQRDDERSACLCHALGEHLWQTGDYAGARMYHEQALASRRKMFGDAHPDTARSLNSLAIQLQRQGELEHARAYHEQALAIRRTVFGESHPETAESLNNLGYHCQIQSDLAGARTYHEQALAIRRATLGPDHPATAFSLTNLAFVDFIAQDLTAAQEHLLAALAIRQQALGDEHADTAETLNDLGEVLQAQHDVQGAQAYFEQALSIRQRVLGNEHPETAKSLHNLGCILQTAGKLEDARAYFARALQIFERRLGADHVNTQQVRAQLAQMGSGL